MQILWWLWWRWLHWVLLLPMDYRAFCGLIRCPKMRYLLSTQANRTKPNRTHTQLAGCSFAATTAVAVVVAVALPAHTKAQPKATAARQQHQLQLRLCNSNNNNNIERPEIAPSVLILHWILCFNPILGLMAVQGPRFWGIPDQFGEILINLQIAHHTQTRHDAVISEYNQTAGIHNTGSSSNNAKNLGNF